MQTRIPNHFSQAHFVHNKFRSIGLNNKCLKKYAAHLKKKKAHYFHYSFRLRGVTLAVTILSTAPQGAVLFETQNTIKIPTGTRYSFDHLNASLNRSEKQISNQKLSLIFFLS